MLKEQVINIISTMVDNQKLELYTEEMEYAEKHELLTDDMKKNLTFVKLDSSSRFADSYIERGDKESEEAIGVEGQEFLKQSIDYLKKHMNEFIYLESNWFEIIGVDAVSLEVDDVFGTYDVMLGLKLKKKFEIAIKEYLTSELSSDEAKFDLMFSPEDGLWNLNFDLNHVSGFNEEMTIGDAYSLIYHFLFKLVEAVEKSK